MQKKHLITTAALLCAAFLCAFAQHPVQGIRLTDAQILNLPKGIINDLPAPQPPTAPRINSANREIVKGWVNPTYSPDSTRIAYTLNNDLYSIEVRTGEIVRHTWDGSELILNGYASWVYYEEIFGRPSKYRAFWWSPDSKILAYYRFDNSKVPMFPIYLPDGHHGHLNQTRYPKAGDNNPEVKIGFVSAGGGETVWADFNPKIDQYFGTPFWSGDGTKLMVSWMDRAQDNLELFSVNPLTGSKVSVYKEHQKSWIDWMDGMLFTSEGIYIVRDFTGWQQIYFLSYDGKKFQQQTTGQNWGVNLLKIVDKKYLFFTARRETSIRTDIYRLNLKTKDIERVSYGDLNFTEVSVSDDGRTVRAKASNSHTPTQLVEIKIPVLGGLNKKDIQILSDSKGPEFSKYALAMPEIVYIPTRDGVSLPALVTWPVDFDKNKKYPVKAYLYGGPDNPQVIDRWRGISMSTQWWANHGVIQIVIDTRCSGHYGKKGVELCYRNLGVQELKDFIDDIKFFRGFSFVDENKIGVEGFSFGGTMTTLCVTEGSDYFKYGIAGGGVYDWSLYDTHYGERYMDRPQDNEGGYDSSRVLDRLSNYKGDKTNMLRITHGTGDDNVHFQNTLQLIDRLQKEHKDFELMIYPGGMHGYRGDQGIHSSMQDYKFWYRYLLDSEMPEILSDYFSKK